MARRDHTFSVNEYYHCYNRGTDKRTIFNNKQDFDYFLRSLRAYNNTKPLGKLRLSTESLGSKNIVEVVAYALLPNHFHLVLKEVEESGVSKLMQRVGIGYAMYFNEKYQRSGSLFQGTFKSCHISNDQNLRQVIGYVRYNNIIHNIKNQDQYRAALNESSYTVRDLISNNDFNESELLEIAEIIKLGRQSLES